jgi:hypothetical protein
MIKYEYNCSIRSGINIPLSVQYHTEIGIAGSVPPLPATG